MSSVMKTSSVVRRAFCIHGLALLAGLVTIALSARRFDSMMLALLAGLGLGWLVGVPLSLLRLRFWTLLVGWVAASCTVLVVSMIGVQANNVLELLWMGAQFGVASSYALLAPRLDTAALWLPLGLHVAGAISWLNRHGVVEIWRADKLAMWDLPSAAMVSVGILFFVATGAARHAVTRARWQSSGVRVDSPAPLQADKGRVLLVGALVVVAVLLVSPFLMRTRAGCEDCTASRPTTPSSTTTEPTTSRRSVRDDDFEARLSRFRVVIVETARASALLVVVAIVGGLASLPVLRRRRLRALERPSSSLPPTERVRRRLRRVEVALQELGVTGTDAGVAPRGLLDAVVAVDDGGGPPALKDAVGLWEQVRFGGRGLPDDVEQRMAQAMAAVVAWAVARRSMGRAFLTAFRVPSIG
jgi:hypothetical protein